MRAGQTAGAGSNRTGMEMAAGPGRNGMGMERVNRIWRHRTYQECLEKIRAHEKTREFCRHTPEHFLDVARLTYILALEEGIRQEGITGGTSAEPKNRIFPPKELIYAAGLLHDIGRHLQYEKGIPHQTASAEIAEGILSDCGFSEGERETILHLIRSHRTSQEGTDLAALFYRADKLSRNCFACPAQEKCDWPETKKNLEIKL